MYIEDFGARADDPEFDNCLPIDAALNEQFAHGGKLATNGKWYHLEKPLLIRRRRQASRRPLVFDGCGAIFDNTIILDSIYYSLRDIHLADNPRADGFVYLRSQGATQINLTAQGMYRSHVFGVRDPSGADSYGANAKNAWGTFIGLRSEDSIKQSFYVDGYARRDQSAMTACTFCECSARRGGAEPLLYQPERSVDTDTQSTMTANTFTGWHNEGNGGIVDISGPSSRGNTFIAPFAIDVDENNDSFIVDLNTYFLGGRIVGNVRELSPDRNVILSHTPNTVSNKGSLHKLPDIDFMSNA